MIAPGNERQQEQFNDRLWMLAHQAEQRAQEQMVQIDNHYAQMGIGLAVFCQHFLETLTDDPQKRFTRQEGMQLLLAAIEMR